MHEKIVFVCGERFLLWNIEFSFAAETRVHSDLRIVFLVKLDDGFGVDLELLSDAPNGLILNTNVDSSKSTPKPRK